MTNTLSKFQRLAEKTRGLTHPDEEIPKSHPFDERNMHPAVDKCSRKLFDDGHYSQATFEVYKFIDNRVKNLSRIKTSGYGLMMKTFNEENPHLNLTSSLDMSKRSKVDVQRGYKHIFAGAMSAIRNPRGHESGLVETPDECLDYLSLASLLLRQLEKVKTGK